MLEPMKSLTWLESRIANFPNETKTKNTIELVDVFGKKTKYELLKINKETNRFDGCGIIRSPFLSVDLVGFVSNIYTAADVRNTTKSTWINEEELRKAMKWALDVNKTQTKYSRCIDIILRRNGDYDGDYTDRMLSMRGR